MIKNNNNNNNNNIKAYINSPHIIQLNFFRKFIYKIIINIHTNPAGWREIPCHKHGKPQREPIVCVV